MFVAHTTPWFIYFEEKNYVFLPFSALDLTTKLRASLYHEL